MEAERVGERRRGRKEEGRRERREIREATIPRHMLTIRMDLHLKSLVVIEFLSDGGLVFRS